MGEPDGATHNFASQGENVVQAQHVHRGVHIHGTTSPESAPVRPHQLPATVRHFINRTVEQDALTTLLNGAGDEHTVLVSTVDGLAGVGKSALVVQWAHQVRARFPDGELYVNLRGFDPAAEPMTASEALAGFLIALGVASESVPATEDARAAQFRTLVHGRRMLIVLDNARDAEHVLPLLPGTAGCLVVVTSRQRLDGLMTHHGAQRLALDTLTSDEGHQLLRQHLGAERLVAEPDAVEAILDHCAGLPLALTLVAVQAATEPDVPLGDLVADLSDERDRLDALDAGGKTGIRAVFSWSYNALSPNAARLFRLLGLPNSPDISLRAAAALADTDHRKARRVLAELCRARVLTRAAGDRYVFHDLLRAYARERAHSDDPEADRNAALQRVLDHHLYTTCAVNRLIAFDRLMPGLGHIEDHLKCEFASDEEALAWWDAEHTNVLATIRQTSALGMYRAPWLAYAATYPFKLRGLIKQLKTASTAGLEAAQRNEDQAAQARLHGDLAQAFQYLQRFDQAAESARISGELFDKLGEPMFSAIKRRQVAIVYLDSGDYTAAVEYARKAKEQMAYLEISLAEESNVVTEPGILINESAATDGALGVALAHCGEFDEAFLLLHRALERCYDDFAQGFNLHRLGAAYSLAGEITNAVDTYRRAVEHRQQLGHPLGEAASLTALGEALLASGDAEAARRAWHQALDIFAPLAHPDAQAVRDHLNALDSADSETDSPSH